MSCRALPVDREVPGSLGSVVRSKACREVQHCDAGALRVECQRGIPASCNLAYAFAETDSERAALVRRYVELSVDGCERGLIDECESMHDLDRKHREAQVLVLSKLCFVTGTYCGLAAISLGPTTTAARDMAERECQVTANEFRRNICWGLLKAYDAGTFPEPVPHRFADLRDWYCRAPVFVTNEICGHGP